MLHDASTVLIRLDDPETLSILLGAQTFCYFATYRIPATPSPWFCTEKNIANTDSSSATFARCPSTIITLSTSPGETWGGRRLLSPEE